MKPECGPQFAGPQHHQSSWGEGEMCQFKPHWHKALPAPSRISEATTKIPSSGQRMSPQLKSPLSNVPASPVLAAELLVTAANSPRARGLLPLLGQLRLSKSHWNYPLSTYRVMLNLPPASPHPGKPSAAPASRPCAPHPFLPCSCLLVLLYLFHILPYWMPRKRDNNVLLSVSPHVASMWSASPAMTNKT